MCIPLVAVAMVMMAASAAAQTYTVYQSSRMQQKAAQYNAKIAKQRALDAKLRGQAEETAHRQRIGQLVGRQRAAIGASGAAVDEGAAARLIEDTMAIGELDALTIRNNAAREAWGFEAQAGGFGFDEALASTQKAWGTAATAFGGAGQTMGMGMKMGAIGGGGTTNPHAGFRSGYGLTKSQWSGASRIGMG